VTNKFQQDSDRIKVVSLFSGCGGMDFGIKAAGGEVIFSNDILADACSTLEKYFPNSEICKDDISNISSFPTADVVVGGYPCQSFSMAGNRDPEKDERTSLYKQFLRAINALKPKYFVAENVSGLQQLNSGSFLKEQVDAYTKAGYVVSYQVLNARDYGVPQSRKRLFIVGVRKNLGQTFVFPAPTHGKQTKKTGPLKPYESHGEAICRCGQRASFTSAHMTLKATSRGTSCLEIARPCGQHLHSRLWLTGGISHYILPVL